MLAKKPPMGWNSWNTFGCEISDKLIREIADVMELEEYREAGYEYISLDDGWLLRERDKNGRLIPDPEKFPNGIKALADFVHEKGFKFGIYSCAGVLTCAGYPGSYGHEYADAEQFAQWGVDLLKYDYCNFPEHADGRVSYLTMSMALKASGRAILFSACNWGYGKPQKWMREIGAHMYRSDTDIQDNYISFKNIALNQIKNLSSNSSGCFNDMDMLTVGMFGKGLVSKHPGMMTMDDYTTQFAFWCFTGSPLIMGGDIRTIDFKCRDLLINKQLILLNQDEECRPPAVVYGYRYHLPEAGGSYILLRFLENEELALGFFNFNDTREDMRCLFADCGLPYSADYGMDLTDIFTGKKMGVFKDYINVLVPPHGCRIFRGKVRKCAEADCVMYKFIKE